MSYITNSFISCEKEVPSYDKNISICLATNGFSFSVISEQSELLSFGSVAYDAPLGMTDAVKMIKGVLDEHKIAPIGFHTVELVVESSHFTMVPDELYEPGNDRKYIETLTDIPMGLSVFNAHNDAIGTQAVFTADSNLVSAFKIALPGVKVKCQYNKLINQELLKRSQMQSVLLLHLRKNGLDAVAYCNRKVQLANSFHIGNIADVIYHGVNIMKLLHLEEAPFEVLVCGDISRQSYSEMQPYFPKVDLYCGRQLSKPNLELQQLHSYRHVLIMS